MRVICRKEVKEKPVLPVKPVRAKSKCLGKQEGSDDHGTELIKKMTARTTSRLIMTEKRKFEIKPNA